MDEKRAKKLSKFMSLLLRHRPQVAGLTLDENGWVGVDDLLTGINDQNNWNGVTREDLEEVVETNNKKRFEFDTDGTHIRARQGHSVTVDLELRKVKPPVLLFHGTVAKYANSICRQGLRKMKRHHVHLSQDQATATDVGGRRGKPLVLTIRAVEMHDAGHDFFLSSNGVWLTEHVPPTFIDWPVGSSPHSQA